MTSPNFTLPTLASLQSAAELVHSVIPPTPQIRWPLLGQRIGAEVWVKHENHHPTGAFKVRGGLFETSLGEFFISAKFLP